MTRLGAALGLVAVSGLLWIAMLAAVAALLAHGADYIIGYGLLAAVLVTLALLMLRHLVREGGR